jgi:hypothetical protein
VTTLPPLLKIRPRIFHIYHDHVGVEFPHRFFGFSCNFCFTTMFSQNFHHQNFLIPYLCYFTIPDFLRFISTAHFRQNCYFLQNNYILRVRPVFLHTNTRKALRTSFIYTLSLPLLVTILVPTDLS